MTDTVIIYGHSDDLIEVEGALRAELDGYENPVTIEFDDGRQFTLTYDGEWTVECVNPAQMHTTDYSDIDIYPVGHIDTFNDYSEVAIYRSWDGVESVEAVDADG